jgi:hypothetical protein
VILLVGIILGLVAGYVRAWLVKRPYVPPVIRHVEVALLAFLPQALVFFVPQTGRFVSHQWAALILPISLAILVLFVWNNRRLQGFWLLGLGLLLNLAVIAANGGLMPISPENLSIVYGTPVASKQAEAFVDSRAFGSKNVVLPAEETRLEWLADRFTLPEELPIQFAFSLGDVFLAVGAFWALWAGGAVRRQATDAVIDGHVFSSQSQRRV